MLISNSFSNSNVYNVNVRQKYNIIANLLDNVTRYQENQVQVIEEKVFSSLLKII